MRLNPLTSGLILSSVVVMAAVVSGCSVEASNSAGESTKPPTVSADAREPFARTKGATIKIEPNSPADTVRVFYKSLREKKFREAIFLTNLRPAIEGLTDAELKEFQVDFEAIAVDIPEELEINGEIISGDTATVTAQMPGEQNKPELQQIKLRRQNDVWVILTVDETAEKEIKKEGRNYFYKLRIETHHDEARQMLDRLSKAELAYSLQNQGIYAEIPVLIDAGYLPPDIQSFESTGYKYSVELAADKKQYSASAVPAAYGKTGKLSFRVAMNEKGVPRLTSDDRGGQPLNK